MVTDLIDKKMATELINNVLTLPGFVMFILFIVLLSIVSNIEWGVVLFYFLFLSWLYLLNGALEKKIPDGNKISRLRTTLFNISGLVSLAYLIVGTIFFDTDIPNFLIPVHILAMFGMIYIFFTNS